MASYYVNEAVFELPDLGFADKTIHAVEAELPNGQKLAVFVHRRPIRDGGAPLTSASTVGAGKSLRALVDENIALNRTRLHHYTVVDEVEAPVGGLQGILVRACWHRERAVFCQRQGHVIVGDNLMIFAVTTPLAEEAAGDEAFESILQTITWRPD